VIFDLVLLWLITVMKNLKGSRPPPVLRIKSKKQILIKIQVQPQLEGLRLASITEHLKVDRLQSTPLFAQQK